MLGPPADYRPISKHDRANQHNPHRVSRVGLERSDEACADGHEDGAGDHEGCVVAESSNEAARNDGCNDNGEHKGDTPNAGFERANTLDGLKPDRKVVKKQEEGSPDEESEPTRGPYATFSQHARVDCGKFRVPELDSSENQYTYTKDDEEGDDTTRGPGVRRTAPLKGKEETDDGRNEDQGARNVELLDAVFPAD